MIQKEYLVLAVLLITGCNPWNGHEIPERIERLENLWVIEKNVEPAFEVQFIQTQTLGDTDTVVIGNPGDIVVDDYGRVYISDLNPNRPAIYVYNPDGSYLATIGRMGRGPGEFNSVGGITYHKGQLFAYDGPLRRFSTFTLSSYGEPGGNSDMYSLSHTVNMDMNSWQHITSISDHFLFPRQFFITDEGYIFTSFKSMDSSNQYLRYYLIDREGQVLPHQILELEENEHSLSYSSGERSIWMQLPTSRKALVAVTADDRIFATESEDFLIRVFDNEGNYKRALYYPYEKSTINRDELSRRYDDPAYRNAVRDADLPETWPALKDLLVDDENRIWVAAIVEDMEVYQWWVLKDNGELLARFQWPRNRKIETIKDGYLYSLETDEETGLQTAVRYRIEMVHRNNKWDVLQFHSAGVGSRPVDID